MNKHWMQVIIHTTTDGLEHLGASLTQIGQTSFVVVDPADFERLIEGKLGAWDYFEKEFLKLKEAETAITLYLSDDAQGEEELSTIQKKLEEIKNSDPAGLLGRLDCIVSRVEDTDWDSSWKKSWEPFAIGEKLMICPHWETGSYDGKTVLYIEPGMAFGTGTDETTSMSLEMLESAVSSGAKVLDIGCGSGILSIAALLLGAQSALGLDIDNVAVKTAAENARLNMLSDRTEFICGSLTDQISETFDIICANIIADVIIELLPEIPRLLKTFGVVILSGIKDDREKDVLDSALALGFVVDKRNEKNGWVCLCVR